MKRAYLAVAMLGLVSSAAHADYIGPSYLSVPGVKGGAAHKAFKGWVRTEAHYWTARPWRNPIRGISGKESGLIFTPTIAPAKGPSLLNVAIDKKSPAFAGMMQLCRSGAAVPKLVFAESADLARHPQEHGPRPKGVPDYYEFELSDVKLTCPVAEAAPEQAFTLSFQSINWLNYKQQSKPIPITAEPAVLAKGANGGKSLAWVVSWFAPIADAADDQCPVMNRKPTQDEYYALMSPERAAKQKAALASAGGANTVVLPYRGPDELNVIKLPGIVADPGFIAPKAKVVRGFDLDGNDGTGPFPSRTREHPNFISPDGRKGIDNQLFNVFGCVEGWRRKGFLPMIGNELRRAGGLSILIEVSGIDDPKNDKDVTVSLYFSADGMRRDGTSKIVLPDYTYRLNPNPEFSQDFARFKGKLEGGVVTTGVLPLVTMHEGPMSTWTMFQARMRLEMKDDGSLAGTFGGYRNIFEMLPMAFFQASDYENTIGFTAPGMYNAVRRAADGLKDPQSGEYVGLSSAYEIEGVPAFIPPEEHEALAGGGAFQGVTKK